MYVDAWFDRDRDCIEITERIQGKRVYKNFPARYSFYYKETIIIHHVLYM